MEIRRIRPDEFEAYREVRLRALRSAPYAYGSTFEEASTRDEAAWREFTERLATSERNAGFVLDRGEGRFGGLASIRFEDDDASAEVNQMWVDEDLRGGTWAKALLDAAEAYASAGGVRRVTLWVTEGNVRAARLYARCGYTPTGATGALPRVGPGLELAKELPESS